MYAELEVREMKIQEVCNLLNLTKKAIYYYEEQGLLSIHKDKNGYRIFNDDDIEQLHEISLYRKLDIQISDVKSLLKADKDEKSELLREICIEKKNALKMQERILELLEQLVDQVTSWEELDEQIDYQNIAKAIQAQIPGIYGKMFMQHFYPYLQGRIETEKQKQAYQRIIRFWDDINLKLPWSIRFIYWLNRHESDEKMMLAFQKAENMKSELLESEVAYEKAKELMEHVYKNSCRLSYKVFNYPQRKLKIRLQNIGYNDIFLPALCDLSPEYHEYSLKWKELNDKVCQDLGLYYNHKMQLCKKK